jgi:hypothetical protein
MSQYLFINRETDESVALEMSSMELFDQQRNGMIILDDGTELHRDVPAEMERDGHVNPEKFHSIPWANGLTSVAMSCNSHQVAEFNKTLQDRGLGDGSHYRADGMLTHRTRSDRKKFCEFSGTYDRDAGYSDQAPKNL